MRVNNTYPRTVLAEGRNSGIGFAFVKEKSKKEYDCVMPMTPCKDFLNEPLFAEKTGVIAPKVYGLKYDKIRGIIGRNYTMMGIKIMSANKSSAFTNKLDAKAEFESNNFARDYKNVEKFLRDIEAKIGLHVRTRIIRAEDKYYLVKMPNYWSEHIYRLSAYTLLLRAFQNIKAGTDSLHALKKSVVYSNDSGLIMCLRKRIDILLNGKDVPKYDFFGKDYIETVEKHQYRMHGGGGICGIELKKVL